MSTLVQPYSQAPIPFGSMGSTPLDLLDAEATPSSDYYLISTSTRTSTLSPFSGISLGSQPSQLLTSESTTSFFDEAIEGPPEPPVDSTMPDLDADQAETELFDAPQGSSTPGSASSKPSKSRTRATKDKASTKTSTKKGPAADKKCGQHEATPQTDIKSKPRKRGRPKNTITEADLEDYPQDELAEDGLPKDPRRRRVLERNRIAATKCRNRKRDEARDLAMQEQEAENRHRYLSSVSDSLTTQIYDLKTQLLGHSDCGCQLIQTYIAHEARRSVDTMVGIPPSTRESEYRASVAASSTGSLNTSPETEGTPAWRNPFSGMPAAVTPASSGFDGGFDNFSMAPVPPNQTAPTGMPVAAFDINNNGMMVPPGHPAAPMMHPPPGQVRFWNPWETQ